MVRGIDASRAFYEARVLPLLGDVPHAAGRIGRGSDVLGLDDEMSQDHDWGERVTVITSHQVPELPAGVELHTLDSFVTSHLGVDPVDDIDWLLLTGQSVLEVIAGPVFRDDTGELTALRSKLQWYPEPVHEYLVAASWLRIDQELRHLPEAKLRRLRPPCADDVASSHGTNRPQRRARRGDRRLRRRLGTAYGARAPLDSESAICAALDALAGRPVCVPFHDRPFRCVDPLFLATMPSDGIGSVAMWCDNVDVLAHPERRIALRKVYESWRARS